MKRIFLVDFTTTSHTFLEGKPKLAPEDEIIIFFGGSYNKLPIGLINEARETNALITEIYKGPKKENIQFIICTYAGFKFGEIGANAEYYVVSKNSQYKALLDYAATNLGEIKIRLVKRVIDAL